LGTGAFCYLGREQWKGEAENAYDQIVRKRGARRVVFRRGIVIKLPGKSDAIFRRDQLFL